MTLLHRLVKNQFGSLKKGSQMLAASINHRNVAPETIRRAAYGQVVSVRLALDLVDLLDIKLEDLRPDLFGRKK